MDRMLYIGMSGARETMLQQQNTTNNLANANTVGFKRDLQAFKPIPIQGPGYASRVYTQDAGIGTDFSQGPMIATGNPLDVAINGPGFIAVQSASGRVSYTRAGNLHINGSGLLVTANNKLVLGTNGPISIPPSTKVDIGSDGTITAVPNGQGPNALAVVGQIKLVDPASSALKKNTQGEFVTKNGKPLPASSNVTLTSGMLEGSNVNAVSSMVRMIELSRQYDLQVRVMKTADQNAQASASLATLA